MLRFVFLGLLFVFTSTLIIVASLWIFVIPDLPDPGQLRNVRFQVPLRIYSADNSLISEFGNKRRLPVNIDQIPPLLIKAVIASEDDRFYEHIGADWHGLLRATISLIQSGKKSQGGSTITMQVARNFFLSREKTYTRKLHEILLAIKIEQEFTKTEILELYFNKVYLGQHAYGVMAAAQIYYGSDLNALSLPQIAMLAGLAQKPSIANPVTDPKQAINRRNYVLRRMLELKFITTAQFNTAKAAPISASLHEADIEVEAPYIAEMVRKYIFDRFGEEAYSNGFVVTTTIKDQHQRAANAALQKAILDYDKRHGYRGAEAHHVLTGQETVADYADYLRAFNSIGELHPALVTAIREKSITVYLAGVGELTLLWEGLSNARKYIDENRIGRQAEKATDIVAIGDVIRVRENADGMWYLAQLPTVEGAMVSLHPNDGTVLSLVGGFNFYRNEFNRVTQAKRQAGSSFKPFIYSAALAAGKTPASLINDAPITINIPGNGLWQPQNYSKKYYGPTPLRVALRHSRNIVAVRLLQDIGIPFALQHAAKFGFDPSTLTKNFSLALGSAAVSPWELARAYAVFANAGHLITPYFIKEITTYDGQIIYQAKAKTVCNDCDDMAIEASTTAESEYAEQTVEARNIWQMNSLMQDVIKNGTSRRALVLDRNDLAGKTGTTNDQYDAWFAGFNSQVVAICWLGFDQFLPLGRGETGARAALPMWIDYMRIALAGQPESVMPRPPGLISMRIDPNTGEPTSTDHPNAVFENFRIEYAPQQQDTPDTIVEEIENRPQEKRLLENQLF